MREHLWFKFISIDKKIYSFCSLPVSPEKSRPGIEKALNKCKYFALLVFAFSLYNTMGPKRSVFYSPQLSLYGSFSSVGWVCIISLNGTTKSFMLSTQHTCSGLWKTLHFRVGNYWAASFYVLQVSSLILKLVFGVPLISCSHYLSHEKNRH